MTAEQTVTTSEDFFKKIGDAAEDVAQAPDVEYDGEAGDEVVPAGQLVDNIESLCMNCEENGTTRLLLTRIPFFREVILMSFYCPHCHLRNNEIQPAGKIQERGSKFSFKVQSKEDMNRQIVKSESCTTKIVELDLEIPPQRGQLTTVEGLINTTMEDLEESQTVRQHVDPDGYAKVQEFITKCKAFLNGEQFPFQVTLDDPAGNSWIEPMPNDERGKWTKTEYVRTKEQDESLALNHSEEAAAAEAKKMEQEDDEIQPDEIHTFPASCPSCMRPCVTRMRMVDIPHFKEVIIMSTVCDDCGYKSNEVKTGGAVPSLGRRITLKVTEAEDLTRDILKSETCALSIPELNVDLTPGTLGGRFTTLEGLITQVYDELRQRIFREEEEDDAGDSMDPETRKRWTDFFAGLKEAIEGKRQFTVILDDPLAASYLQNLYAPDPDPNMTIEDVERTHEQEEDLGLLDMKTENYGDDGDKKDEKEEEAKKE